jgi:hypothetical protein
MTDPSDATGEEPANPPAQRTLVRPPRVLQVGKTYDPLPRREKTRSWLAFSLVALLATIALSLIGLTAGKLLDPSATKDLVAGILSPLTALTGAALGFYFGGHHGPS